MLEDDLLELRRRVRAAMLHYGFGPEDVRDIYSSPPRAASRSLNATRRGELFPAHFTMPPTPLWTAKADLMSDPAIKAHAVDENSNPQIDAFASLLTQLAQTKNIAIDLLSHERKALRPEAGDANRQRGAGSLKDAARLVYTLTGMSLADAEALGVGEAERKLLFRVDSAKVNLAPPDQTTKWFRLVGVALGNGAAGYPNGDTVQTCEPWQPRALFDGLTTTDLNKVLLKLNAGMGDGRKYSTAAAARERPLGGPSRTTSPMSSRRDASSSWPPGSRMAFSK